MRNMGTRWTLRFSVPIVVKQFTTKFTIPKLDAHHNLTTKYRSRQSYSPPIQQRNMVQVNFALKEQFLVARLLCLICYYR